MYGIFTIQFTILSHTHIQLCYITLHDTDLYHVYCIVYYFPHVLYFELNGQTQSRQ